MNNSIPTAQAKCNIAHQFAFLTISMVTMPGTQIAIVTKFTHRAILVFLFTTFTSYYLFSYTPVQTLLPLLVFDSYVSLVCYHQVGIKNLVEFTLTKVTHTICFGTKLQNDVRNLPARPPELQKLAV